MRAIIEASPARQSAVFGVWSAGSFTGGCERRNIKGERAATVAASRRRDVMGGPEWLLEPRQETAADPGLVMVVSALATVRLTSRYTTSADMIISFVSKGKDHANHTA